MPTPEDKAREHIDQALEQAGWKVQDYKSANLHAGRGVVLRNFPLASGHGFADYLLYLDGKAAGVIEAKKEGFPLVGVEVQAEKYSKGLPTDLPAHIRPLPFLYQSTGVETRFTNGLDPQPRSRPVFSFHRPETLAALIPECSEAPKDLHGASLAAETATTLRGRLRTLPPLSTAGLWPAQITAINNLEKSLAQDRPRALIQMATGSGKTFTAINFIYRLIKFGGARRVLFLVDRGNLGDQTLKEFQQYVSPYNNFKFTEEFIVQRLAGNTLDTTARVCISTIQRMYSMLKGRELSDEDEEASVSGLERLFKQPEPIDYNPAIPIETFDIIVTDECHRSIYNLWAQVLEYFDAHLIGLTATPNKQTFGFFNQNLVMEYNHEQAVADGVNVNYDVYRIRTSITQAGSTVEAGYSVQLMNRETRTKRWERLDDDFAYDPDQLDRDVVAPDQIRTIVKAFKDKLFTDIFPGRTEVPKTLIFAKDDAHAENIVEILREEFGKGNEFALKITYRTTGVTPKDLIKSFRNSYHPRIAVTVDMIATGTDIKPVEIVVFMRAVKSRTFFEQMKGRGVRVIKPDDLKAVTPDATTKDHFVIVDTVGVCEQDKTDARPMEKKPSVAFEKLLQAVALGNMEEDVLTSIAGRLARMEHRITKADEQAISKASGGLSLKDLSRSLVEAVNPDRQEERATQQFGTPKPTEQQIQQVATKLIQEAAKPFHDPKLRELLIEIKKKNELTIDHVSQDQVIGKKSSTTIVGEEGQVSKERDIVERDDFWATTSNKQLNFVQHVKTLLKQNGRAAVVVPDNVLFEGGAGETVRRKLLHECDVHTLLRLPTGLFYAQGVKANVLFFDKKPASETPWTKKLWIYDLRTNQHFTLKTDPLKREDLDEFVKCYNGNLDRPDKQAGGNRHTRKATWSDKKPDGRWRAYDYDELIARDKASLDIFWLKDDSLEDSANLPNPDIIAQEIVDDLESAIEQFRLIAGDLGGATSNTSG